MLLATASTAPTDAAWLDVLAVAVCAATTPAIFLAVGFWMRNELRARSAEREIALGSPDREDSRRAEGRHGP
jgi:hypothetical protein